MRDLHNLSPGDSYGPNGRYLFPEKASPWCVYQKVGVGDSYHCMAQCAMAADAIHVLMRSGVPSIVCYRYFRAGSTRMHCLLSTDEMPDMDLSNPDHVTAVDRCIHWRLEMMRKRHDPLARAPSDFIG